MVSMCKYTRTSDREQPRPMHASSIPEPSHLRDQEIRPAPESNNAYWGGLAMPVPLLGADLGYSSVIRDSWRQHFRGFRPGARILDIAAGIGAVAVIASEVSHEQGSGFEIHSLDQAATLLDEPLDINGIRFHASGYNEQTSFADGYFDAITGQSILPDAEAPATLSELRRVLEQGGTARFMFHALHGATYESCKGRIKAIDAFLDDLRILEHARNMFMVAFTQDTALKRDPVHAAMLALGAQQRYADAAAAAALWVRGTPNPGAGDEVLALITNCWERRYQLRLKDILARLDRVESRLRAAQARMRAICTLAVDETRMHRIGRLFKAAGFDDVKVKTLTAPDDGVTIGWDLLAA